MAAALLGAGYVLVVVLQLNPTLPLDPVRLAPIALTVLAAGACTSDSGGGKAAPGTTTGTAGGATTGPGDLTKALIAIEQGPKYGQSDWGYIVLDKATGEVLASQNPTKMFDPGSTMKTFAWT